MSKKILIGEDDREYAEELKELFDVQKYDVVTYHDSGEILKEAPKQKPDLILLDIKMEGISGIQVAALLKMKSSISKTPILLMSAFYNEQELNDAMKICNIKKFFKKPIDPAELIEEVNLICPVN
jgi:DNA-binding response OmpR family regulator